MDIAIDYSEVKAWRFKDASGITIKKLGWYQPFQLEIEIDDWQEAPL